MKQFRWYFVRLDHRQPDYTMKRRRRGAILVVIGSVFVGLFISEIALRIAGFSFQTFDMADRERGLALRPGAEGWWRREGEAYVRINSDGLRDRDHPKRKPANTVRIAVLGDSYAEALQVPMEDAFWAVMERQLSACKAFGGRKVEMINFGVSGYQTAQELVTLRRYVWDYSPDIVLLTVTTANDIRDNSPRLASYPYVPFGVYRNGALVINNSAIERRAGSFSFRLQQSALGTLFYWMRDHSRVVQLLDKVRFALHNLRVKKRPRDDARSDTPEGEEVGLDDNVYLEPNDPAWDDAWRVTEGLISLMRDEVRDRGASFFVVTLSNSIQVNPNHAARQRFMNRLGVADLFYPDGRIKALGERNHIPVFNLAPVLQSYADQTGLFLHGFNDQPGKGHWNTLGHQMAGELIAQKLCEESTSARDNR
jgi:hypothetical protein